MGKKYIIETGDGKNIIRNCGKTMLTVQMAIGKTVGSINTGIELTPYTEPDLEQVRKEAYDNGYEDAEEKYNDGYSDGYDAGLIDTWEACKKIINMNAETSEKVFGEGKWFTKEVVESNTATEAIAKIKAWEQEIKVGDEVEAFEKKPFIVTCFGYGDDEEDVYCHGFVTENGIPTSAKKNSCVRTGRHFPEIVAVLEKMRGEKE